MENRNSEKFYQELAKAYADQEDAALLRELAEIDRDARRHKSKNKRSMLLSLAAILVFAAIAIGSFRSGLPWPSSDMSSSSSSSSPSSSSPSSSLPSAAEEAPADKLQESIRFVNANLPAGYNVERIDYDHSAAIMEITNEKRNAIRLIAEEYDNFETRGLSRITLNGNPAYGLVKNDYCVLKFGRNGILYTISSMYAYEDLVELCKTMN
ncbi:MAG: hypothetical protein FWH28_08980 [Clostridiales bacterium]|nr:hypothetical protein [Clostridiales bacterium]